MTRPTSQSENLEALPAFPPETNGSADLWTEVHERVQAQLGELEKQVRRRVPNVQVANGRTSGKAFCLFTYRAFSIPGSGLDPVVCGVTFWPVDQGVRIEGDTSGESLGDVIFEVPTRTVANSKEALLAEATELARELGRSADAVVGALKDATRKVK
jgi:hypothetical protein